MSDFVIKPGEVEKWTLGSHVGVESRLLVNGDHITVLLSHWGPGATAPEHVHPHEQVGICLQGHVIVTIGGEDHPVGPGEFYHIPGRVPHAERNEGADGGHLRTSSPPSASDLVRRQFEAQVV